MNNLLSYCGLVDVRINVSDKDLPVVVAEILYETSLQEGMQSSSPKKSLEQK